MAHEDTRPRGIPFNTMPSKLWDLPTKVSYLQRRVIVYSIAYYECDTSILTDVEYDGISRQLARLQSKLSDKELSSTRYGYAFEGFDGSTAFDIPHKLTPEDYEYLRNMTMHIVALKQEPEPKHRRKTKR